MKRSHRKPARDTKPEQRLAPEVIDLIRGGEARLSELRLRVRSLGLDPELPMVAMALEPADSQVAPGVLAETAELFFTGCGHRAVTSRGQGHVVAIVSVRSDEAVLGLAIDLNSEFERQGWAAIIGVGGICRTGSAQVHRSVVQAEQALNLARAGGRSRAVTSYADAGSYASLFATQDAKAKRGFIRSVLGALIDHDRRHHAELVHTLDEYLSAGANCRRAADRLHVHVNTVRYRISQIERITTRDLSSMDDRVSIYVALRGAAALKLSG